MSHIENRARSRSRLCILALCLATAGLGVGQNTAWSSSLPTLLVGGGPSPAHNQVALENNIRYLLRLLPKQNRSTVLFADGNKNNPTVLYQAEDKPTATGETTPPDTAEWILDYVLGESKENQGTPSNQSTPTEEPLDGQLKAPNLPQLDGASKRENIVAAFGELSATKPTKKPLLLYFTGHGSPTPDNHENNYYYLWNDGQLTVQDLAKQVARLPEKQAVVLVMVQCYSGAFANLLFEGGEPKAQQTGRDLVGFFAATKDRVAAGCTPEINEANYRDFTSYFFAALTGRDRLNRKAAPDADFNRDGQVGLDEAFYWAVINDESIDVPVATSDLFLERFSPLPNEDWQQTPYSSLLKWASPAQRATLIALSQALALTGENRLSPLASKVRATQQNQQDHDPERLIKQLQQLGQEERQALLEAFPDLAAKDAEVQVVARQQALARIREEIKNNKWKVLAQLSALYAPSSSPGQEDEGIREAKELRFVRLAQKIVRDHQLRISPKSEIKKRYLALLKCEGRRLLPYQG